MQNSLQPLEVGVVLFYLIIQAYEFNWMVPKCLLMAHHRLVDLLIVDVSVAHNTKDWIEVRGV